MQSSVSTVMDGGLAKGEAEKRMIKNLKKHAIVFGYGQLGRYVTEKLDELGFDYVVITKDRNFHKELLKSDAFSVLEDETQPIKALKAAGVDSASMIIAAHEKDSDNMLIILSARKLRPDIRIISVVNNQDLTEPAKNAGADMVITASATIGHLLALSAVTKNLVGVVFSEKSGPRRSENSRSSGLQSSLGRGCRRSRSSRPS